jgi:hypothetical protein
MKFGFFPQKTMKTISITSQFSVFGSLQELPATSEHDGTGRGCEKKKHMHPIQNSE